MSVLGFIFSAAMLAETLRMSVPYICAGIGGVWSERSGIVNIALEGILLCSGLAAIAAHVATGSAWVGVIAGVVCGAMIGWVHALIVEKGRVNAIVSGLAINLAALGATRFLLRALYDSSSNSPAVEGLRAFPGASPLLRAALDPLFLISIAAVGLTGFVLYRTKIGLRVRACGEDPDAAASAGVAVRWTRVFAVSVGGAICGLGGTALALDQHQFQSGMSGGRGFIALAAVILSGWRPGRTAVACALFAGLDAAQIVLQDRTRIPPYAVQMLPYVCTLLALFIVAQKRGIAAFVPAGLGKSASDP